MDECLRRVVSIGPPYEAEGMLRLVLARGSNAITHATLVLSTSRAYDSCELPHDRGSRCHARRVQGIRYYHLDTPSGSVCVTVDMEPLDSGIVATETRS